MEQTVSDWIEATYPGRLAKIREQQVRRVLSLCVAEIESIIKNPEQTDLGNESFFRHRDDFQDLIFAHNGAEDQFWEGLRCNGAYLTPEEYQFIVHCRERYQFNAVVESGAGETSIFFSRLGCSVLSIEYQEGPWVKRALEGGAQVKIVSFDQQLAEFNADELQSALRGQRCELLFIDSPIGTRNRSKVLEKFCIYLHPHLVLIHDAHRDAPNIYNWMRRFDLRILEYLPSRRGLLLLRRDN
jgi:hypothetical protein